jgi:hypothetical protein
VTLNAEHPNVAVPDAVGADDGTAKADEAQAGGMGDPAHESVAGWSGAGSDRDPQAR